jgi:hypothetical protein
MPGTGHKLKLKAFNVSPGRIFRSVTGLTKDGLDENRKAKRRLKQPKLCSKHDIFLPQFDF